MAQINDQVGDFLVDAKRRLSEVERTVRKNSVRILSFALAGFGRCVSSGPAPALGRG